MKSYILSCSTGFRRVAFPILASVFALTNLLRADTKPSYWSCAPTPPMGWNSYDAWGSSVTEEEVLANAGYMHTHLLSHGWKYVVIDFRWYDSVSSYNDHDLTKERSGAKLFADEFGRMLPATNRACSAAAGCPECPAV